ncbi:general stress protein [Listeria booriae]|uniref:Sulfate transporter n=1 Tax=Listeria booriae TaxID=1552123 RepID=A0A7X0YJH5_9LIST|nr:general stress protein [Listeria booriae]MBC1557870.1 sulfate transporter [Listeria booriae]MBC1572951.1 sulfate transporter [Listeria booriae]MBC1796298.1 sulfate transporter [Listeria booriae]MBC1799559.1 sulfate transporter [Listeria booriae]MBC1974622.1 sulfate transporter [Listeria booriae]
MENWEVFVVGNDEEAVAKITELEVRGYKKENISILAKSDQEDEIEEIIESTDVERERPVNEAAFGVISGILQSLSGAIVIPQVYNPKYGALYAAGPFAKWFSNTSDKSVKRLLADFDLTDTQIDEFVRAIHSGEILILAR